MKKFLLYTIPLIVLCLIFGTLGIVIGAHSIPVSPVSLAETADVSADTSANSDPEDGLSYGLKKLREHEFQRASSYLHQYYEDLVLEADAPTPDEMLNGYRALLGSSLANLNLRLYYQTIRDVLACSSYFENLSPSTLIAEEELRDLRLFTNLCLVHLYTEYGYYKDADEYLGKVSVLMETVPNDNWNLHLFHAYETAHLSPLETGILENLLNEWTGEYTEEETESYIYNYPKLILFCAQNYTDTDPEKAGVLYHHLMRQGAEFGNDPTEKAYLAADLFMSYAEYLDETGEDNSLFYRKKAAALYESLLVTHCDGIVIDGVFYKQTADALYYLAEAYADAGETTMALEHLEHADRLLNEITVEAYKSRLDNFALAAALYEKTGDSERAKNRIENYRFTYNELPEIMSGYPIHLSDLAGRNLFPEDSSEEEQLLMVVRHNNPLRRTDSAQLFVTEEGKQYPTLVQAAECISHEVEQITESAYATISMLYRAALVNNHAVVHILTTNLEIVRCDENFLSVLLRVDSWGSGPHELTTWYAFNYDRKNNQLVPESELTSEKLYEAVKKLAEEKNNWRLMRDPDAENSEILITDNGYEIIFQPGTVATYADGTITVEVPQE